MKIRFSSLGSVVLVAIFIIACVLGCSESPVPVPFEQLIQNPEKYHDSREHEFGNGVVLYKIKKKEVCLLIVGGNTVATVAQTIGVRVDHGGSFRTIGIGDIIIVHGRVKRAKEMFYFHASHIIDISGFTNPIKEFAVMADSLAEMIQGK